MYRVLPPFWGRRHRVPLFIAGSVAAFYLAVLAVTTGNIWPLSDRLAAGYAILAAGAVTFALYRWFQRVSWINGLLGMMLVTAGAVLMSDLLADSLGAVVDAAPIAAAVALAYFDGVRRRIDGRAIRFFLRRLDFRRSDPLLRQIVHNSFVGILTIDGDGKIDSANAAVEKMFGHDTGQLYGLHARHLFYELFERAPS
ncbi:MAG: PAS domain S-box protein, partial [Alphaproteobacteria bacterium]|nr:PAS domain S-box protein [Alphaproteobacteria bacterium]